MPNLVDHRGNAITRSTVTTTPLKIYQSAVRAIENAAQELTAASTTYDQAQDPRLVKAVNARQKKAAEHAVSVPEVIEARRTLTERISRVTLKPMQQVLSYDDQGIPQGLELQPSALPEAWQFLAEIDVDGRGLAGVLARASSEVFIGGEAYLVHWLDGNEWHWACEGAAGFEYEPLRRRYKITTGNASPVYLPDSPDTVRFERIFTGLPSPNSGVAWSGLMGCQEHCQTLNLIDRLLKVIARVSLFPGIFLVPVEVQPPNSGDDPGNAWVSALDEAITLAIRSTDTTAETNPIIAMSNAEYLDHVRHVQIDRPYDERILTVRKYVAELVLASVSVEARFVDGSVTEAKYANAEQVRQNMDQNHVQPRSRAVAAALTRILKWRLRQTDTPEDAISPLLLSPDFSELDERPTRSEALAAFSAGIISASGARELMGIDQAHAPTPEELQAKQELTAAAETNVVDQINEIDRDLRAALLAASAIGLSSAYETIVKRAKDAAAKAGRDLDTIASSGIDIEQLAGKTLRQADAAGSSAIETAYNRMAALGGETSEAWLVAAKTAWHSVLVTALLGALSAYPDAPDFDIPTPLISSIGVTLGGGSSISTAGVGGIGASAWAAALFAALDIPVLYRWIHSGKRRPCIQHKALDGVTFRDWGDPVLSGNPDEWPFVASFRNTDHPLGADHWACGCYTIIAIEV